MDSLRIKKEGFCVAKGNTRGVGTWKIKIKIKNFLRGEKKERIYLTKCKWNTRERKGARGEKTRARADCLKRAVSWGQEEASLWGMRKNPRDERSTGRFREFESGKSRGKGGGSRTLSNRCTAQFVREKERKTRTGNNNAGGSRVLHARSPDERGLMVLTPRVGKLAHEKVWHVGREGF